MGGRRNKGITTVFKVFKMKEVVSRESRVLIEMGGIYMCVVIYWGMG